MIRYQHVAMGGIGCAMILAISALSVAGDNQGTVAAEKAAIRKAGAAYLDALSRGDAQALAAHWTVGGIYADASGRSFKARELIKEQFGRAAAAESPVRAADPDSSIRFVTPNVAVEEGTFQLTPTSDADDSVGKFTATWVKKDQGWLLDSLREWESAFISRGSRLGPLAWLIGDWVGEGDGFTVRCSTKWSENKKFIVRRFTVERGGREALRGTQRIGWDPSAGRIRSWVFDSDGGIVEGRWRSEGDSWIVKTKGVLPDGRQSSAVNFWVLEGDGRCVIKTSHVRVGDTKMEDSVVEFRRSRADSR